MQQTTQQQQQQSNTGEKRKRKRKTDNSSMPIPSSPSSTLNDLTPNNSKNLKYDISSGSTVKKNILDLYSRVIIKTSSFLSLTLKLLFNL